MIQSVTFFEKPDDILKYHNKDANVNRRNTWDDWHILSISRPVFAPPDVKTNYINVPGGNGSLDLSESLTRYPTYNNRTGTFKFKVMNDYEKDNRVVYESNDTSRWAQRYSEIMEYLHGKVLCVVLEDDPAWFYQGRFTVDSWGSGETWSEITIGYNVNTFKWNVSSSIDQWLWDPFNFETDIIWEDTCKNIPVDSPNNFTEISLPPKVLDKSPINTLFGSAPISPTIKFSPGGKLDEGIDILFINNYLGINMTQHFKGGATFAPDFIFYGQTEPYKMCFKGTGTVSIDFRVGRL